LRLLDLRGQLLDKDLVVPIALLALLHLRYLEVRVPIKALDYIIDSDILVELFILRVINLDKKIINPRRLTFLDNLRLWPWLLCQLRWLLGLWLRFTATAHSYV